MYAPFDHNQPNVLDACGFRDREDNLSVFDVLQEIDRGILHDHRFLCLVAVLMKHDKLGNFVFESATTTRVSNIIKSTYKLIPEINETDKEIIRKDLKSPPQEWSFVTGSILHNMYFYVLPLLASFDKISKEVQFLEINTSIEIIQLLILALKRSSEEMMETVYQSVICLKNGDTQWDEDKTNRIILQNTRKDMSKRNLAEAFYIHSNFSNYIEKDIGLADIDKSLLVDALTNTEKAFLASRFIKNTLDKMEEAEEFFSKLFGFSLRAADTAEYNHTLHLHPIHQVIEHLKDKSPSQLAKIVKEYSIG